MRCFRPVLAGLFIATLVWPLAASGDSYTLVVPSDTANTDDAYLREDDSNQQNGDKNELYVKDDTGNKSRHTILRPDLSALSGFSVLRARLSLLQHEANDDVPIDVRTYALTEDWTEYETTWDERSTGIPWNTPGGTHGSLWTDRGLASKATKDSVMTWEVGPILAAMQGSVPGTPAYGLLMRGQGTDPEREVRFRSTEETTVGEQPRWEIVYTDDPPAVSFAVAEVQPTSVEPSASGVWLSIFVDIDLEGTTPTGDPTGVDLVKVSHQGALTVTGVEWADMDGLPIDPAQVSWSDDGTDLILQLPDRITATGRLRVDVRADISLAVSATDFSLPVLVNDSATGADYQAAWCGDADGVPGNGDDWVVSVANDALTSVDLTPDAADLDVSGCTLFRLTGEGADGATYPLDPDSLWVVPTERGTVGPDGEFCAESPGTGALVAAYGAWTDTSWVTVNANAPSVIHELEVLDGVGDPVTAFVPLDTFFVDVTLEDDDGFGDISRISFSVFMTGYEGDTSAPAFSAGFRWDRDPLPGWSVEYPSPTTWQLLPDLCVSDTPPDDTGPATVRLAFTPGKIARQNSAVKWAVRAAVTSDTPPATVSELHDKMNMGIYLEMVVAETEGVFSPGQAGDTDRPLVEPADGKLDVAIVANAPLHFKGLGESLVGATVPTDVIPVSASAPNIEWVLDPGGSGVLDSSFGILEASVPALETETPLQRDLYLTLDLPEGLSEQDYEGAIQLRLSPLTVGTTLTRTIPLTARILPDASAAESALAEVLPDSVVAGTAGQAFTMYLTPQFDMVNTGIDWIRIPLPSGYGAPVVDAVTVDGAPVAFADESASDAVAVALGERLTTDGIIAVVFTADVPTEADPGGGDFVVWFDDTETAVPPQTAEEGDADGADGGDDWRVVVTAGPPAAVVISPESAVVFLDSTAVFTADVADAFGNPATAGVSWTAEGGVGTVDGFGVFTASTAGAGRVIAETAGLRDTSTVTVIPNAALVLRSVNGPSSAAQGDADLELSVRLANPGTRAAVVDSLVLGFTRSVAGDANGDFLLTPDGGNPGTVAAGAEALFRFTAEANRDAAPGNITVDARAVGAEYGSGSPLADDAADTTLVFALTPGGITVRAEQASGVAAPASTAVPLLTLALANAYPDPVTLEGLTLANLTSGPGTQAERDTELGTATLYQDDGDGVFDAEVDAPLASAAAASGALSFDSFTAGVAGADSLRLFVAFDLPHAMRDGDMLDIAVDGESDLLFTTPVFTRNSWPLDPSGSLLVDGMVAAQIDLASVPGTQAVPGQTRVHGLDVTVPRNGYEDDVLTTVRLTNLGTALPGSDLDAVEIWRDGGNGVFDGGSTDDALLGAATWDGSCWCLAGLNQAVAAEGLRLFGSFDIAAGATVGRTVRLALPTGASPGFDMASDNDGPRDAAVANPGTQVIVTDPSAVVRATANPQASAVLHPGGAGVEVFRVTVENATAAAETLAAMSLENTTAGLGTAAQLDADWSALGLTTESAVPGGPSLGGSPTATVAADHVVFNGLGLVLDPGDQVDLVVTGGASLTAREGDLLDLRMAGPEGLQFTRTVPFDAAWPLQPAGFFSVDGMVAAQVRFTDHLGGAVAAGDANRLALTVRVPANGYAADVLQQVLVGNLGDAAPADLSAVRVWRDGGDGVFNGGSADDVLLGAAAWNGSHWVLGGLSQTVPVSGLRLFVSVDVAPTATLGRTIRFWLPPTPDDAFRTASGNSGPLDAGIANSGSIVIAADPDAAVRVAALDRSSSDLLPGGDPVEALVLTVENATAFPETLSAVTLSNATSGPGTVPQRDAEWSSLSLALDASPGVTDLAGALPAAGFASGVAVFGGMSVEIQPGATAVLRVSGGATLSARDGDVLDLSVTGPASLGFSRGVVLDGAWPIDPAGSFTVDGMAAAQIGVDPVPGAAPAAGSEDVLAFDLLVPANGYESDVLERIRFENEGTAEAGADVAALRIVRDGGNGTFDAGAGDDAVLGETIRDSGGWVLSGLSEPVPAEGLRLFAVLDLNAAAEPGRTVQLALPSSPDLGLLMGSGNDGPRDLRVTAADPLTVIADPDASLHVTAGPQTGDSLLPGGGAVELLRLQVENRTAFAETLRAVTVTTETNGPGDEDDLSAAWSALELVPVGAGDKPRGPSALPGATDSHGTASALFDELALPIPAGGTLTLSISGGASLTARDGDAFDLRVEQAGDLVFSGSAPTTGDWPLDPEGSFLVDGMAAAQIALAAIPDGVVDVGDDHRIVFDLLVPANGYEADVLQALRLEQLGTAESPRDIARVTLWADGGDGLFDAGSGDDVTLGEAVPDGASWSLSGLDAAIPRGGRRVYAGVDIGDEAEPGRTVRFALPSSPAAGLTMASGNDGPRDAEVANPGTLTIIEDLSGELELSAGTVSATTLLPGGPLVEAFRLRLENSTAVPETLFALSVRNTSRGPGTQADLDAEWTPAYLLPAPGATPSSPENEALASALFSGGALRFSGFTFVVPSGEARELAVYAGASLAARDSDGLDMALTGPEAAGFRPPVSVSGSWPLNPAGAFRVDGMAAAQIAIDPVPAGNLESGSIRNPALNLVLPRNGYTDDTLERLDVVNLGTARAGLDIEAVELWADDGNGAFEPAADRLLGPLTYTGNRWEITGLAEPVGAGGLRVHLSVDIAELAVEGRSVELAVPSLPDLGVGMQSGNDGPLDVPVANGDEQIITVADRLILSASPIASGVAHPGDDDVPLLGLTITNTYDAPRTLSGVTFADASTGAGSEADLDGAFDVLLLAVDRNGNGLYDADDDVLGSAAFTAGRVSFQGLDFALPSDRTGRLFLVGDVSLRGAADGDILAARLSGPLDLDFAEPTAVAASWPLDSGARWVVNGMVADQITRFDTGPATVGPGAGPLAALDVIVPGNGYLGDELNGLRVVNRGSAGEADLADVHLWRDGGDGVFSPSGGDDLDLGSFSWIGDSWQSLFLEDAVPRDGARYFVAVAVGEEVADSSTVRLEIPVNGITMSSGNDGPLDRAVGNEQAILLSSAPILAGLAVSPAASTVGQNVTVTMSVTNVTEETVRDIAPSALAASGTGALAPAAGPAPATLTLAPGETGSFVWTLTAAAAGPVELSGLATGTGAVPGDRRSLTTVSNRHQVFVEADDLELFALESMPFSVSLGQRAVVPLSLTFRNPGSETGSDILVTAVRIRLEDENAAGLVPADLLTRVVVNEGNRVYLDRSAAQLETSGSEANLVLATPVRVTKVEPTTLNLQLDIAEEAVASNFRIVIADSSWVKAADATSGAPVAISLQERPYPVQSGLARIVAEAERVSVTGTETAERRVGPGARDVDLLTVTLENPGLAGISADVRLGAFAVRLTDAEGAPVAIPRDRLDLLKVKTAFQTLAVHELTPIDGETMALQLSPPLALPVNTPVAVTVSGDLALQAPVGTVRLELAEPARFDCRDAITRNLVPAIYEPESIRGHMVRVENPADSVLIEGSPMLPPSLLVGAKAVEAMSATVRHPGPAGTARIRLDALTVECRNEAHLALTPSRYLDRVSVVWKGEEAGWLDQLPVSGGSFEIPLSGIVLEPGESGSLLLIADVETSAPAASLELIVPGTGVAAVDLNSGRPVAVAPAPGAELPLYSGLTRFESPARDLIAGLDDRMPAVLVPETPGVEAGILRLRNPAAEGAGVVQIDHVVVRASDRLGAPIDLGSALDRVSLRFEGEVIGASADLSPDSSTAVIRFPEALSLQAGEELALAVVADLRASPAVDGMRIGFDRTGIGVVQPEGALFEVEVRSREGEAFPLWTAAGSFTPAGLERSYSNFPNPFAAGREPTTFVFNLAVDAVVTLRIWTPRGDEVVTLIEDEPRAAGLWQSDRWDGRNGQGAVVINGVYIAELTVTFVDGRGERLLRKVAVTR